MTRKLIIAAAFTLFAAPAFAFQCPGDVAKIDAALPTAQLSDADLAKVKELRNRGAELHAAKQHQQSVDTLAEAMGLLGIS